MASTITNLGLRQARGGLTSVKQLLRSTTRPMSVLTLGDEDAVKKFRVLYPKSVLYFTATWCPPCKAIAPKYEAMSDKYPSVAFGKVDVDDNGEAATEFEIRAVPMFVLFDGETVQNRLSGADAGKLESLIGELEAI